MSWYEESVVYQVYPLGLCGAPHQNDGASEPERRLHRLVDDGWVDHMSRLGASCLMLNPVFQSSSHGYDTIDYLTLDRRLGTNDDLRALVDACHEAGIKVLLDAVLNHVGRDFWAFRDVLQNREASPYAGWFNIDWGGNDEWDDGLSYECWQGVPYLVKLNHSDFALNDYLADVIRQWEREFDVDGLRLDVAYCLDRGYLAYLRRITNELTEARRGRLGERDAEFVLVGETMFGDYRQWMGDELCHSVTNYEAYKGLWSSLNAANMHEVAYALERQSGSHPWDLYTGRHLLNFVDNHDVPRIATRLDDPRQLPALYGLLFAMPGVPCVYYGSEWGVEGEQHFGDYELRPALDAPEWNDLTSWVASLAACRRPGHPGAEALAWGDYAQLDCQPRQLLFQRQSEHERLIVAVNAADEPHTFHFDARCGRAVDVITGEDHDFGGGSEVPPLGVRYWLCER